MIGFFGDVMTMLKIKIHKSAAIIAATVMAAFVLAGCGGGSGAQGGAGGISKAAKIIMKASQVSVKSDNSDSSIITATVVDVNGIPVSGGTLHFSTATADALGVSSGVASTTGVVTIPFSAGSNRASRTETITAALVNSSITGQIPIQVAGSSMTLTSSLTSVRINNPLTLTANVKDATPTGVSNQSVLFSIPTGNGVLSGGTVGTGTASMQTVTSGSTGDTTAVTFIPSIAGSVTVTADWIDTNGNVSLTVTKVITVTDPGIAFAVTSPTTNPTSLTLLASSPVTVSVPTSISGTAVANVRFSTTLGAWSNSSKSSTIVPAANAVSEILTAGGASGIANVQIDALDGATPAKVLSTLNLIFALSAPSTAAGAITLQASISNVPASTAGTSNSTTLIATVRTGPGGNTVAGVPVLFEIMNPTGSGEQISPVVVNTDSAGKALSTFISGSQSTVGGLKIKASVVGTSSACDNSVLPVLPGICDVKKIFVNGSGVSVSLGQANKMTSTNNNTTYDLPMSVLVVSNTGAPVPNAEVTMTAFPTEYSRGWRNGSCDAVPDPGYPKPNEDINENDNLDPGEDADGNGLITPPHSSAGTIVSIDSAGVVTANPAGVFTTDGAGIAVFHLVYQKQYADWIKSRIRAKVVILAGTTESTNELQFWLPHLIDDATPCTLPNSPLN